MRSPATPQATGATLADIVTIVILTLFLLSGGRPMLARMAAWFWGVAGVSLE